LAFAEIEQVHHHIDAVTNEPLSELAHKGPTSVSCCIAAMCGQVLTSNGLKADAEPCTQRRIRRA